VKRGPVLLREEKKGGTDPKKEGEEK